MASKATLALRTEPKPTSYWKANPPVNMGSEENPRWIHNRRMARAIGLQSLRLNTLPRGWRNLVHRDLRKVFLDAHTKHFG